MKGYLCLVWEEFRVHTALGELPADFPTDTGLIGVLGVYKSKAAARKIHGPRCQLREVNVNPPKKGDAK